MRLALLAAPMSLFAWLTFTITPGWAADPPGDLKVEAGKDKIDFKVGDSLVTSYVVGPRVAKPYFFPVYGARGVTVTRPWPMLSTKGEATDHKHQKSLWFCHGDVIPEGIALAKKTKQAAGVDFWSEEEGHGRIRCTKVETPKVEKDHGWVQTTNEWITPDGVKILDETRVIHFYKVGPANLIVLDIDLQASVCPITFGDTKEGSLGVRVRECLRVDKGKGKLTNAEGKSGEGKLNNVAKDGVWGLKSDWCDYSGPIQDTTAGISLFADPSNPHPTYWHSRNYGLMAANPFGRAKSGFPDARGSKDVVKLDKGEHLKLRYGVFVHPGDVQTGKVAEAYQRFVRLKEEK